MNPLNWRHYAGLGYYMVLLVRRIVLAGQDGKLNDAEWEGISAAFRSTVEELLFHVGGLTPEEQARRLNP